jgi:hypothetical protein
LPDGPITERQRKIADAVRHCHSLADFAAAESRRVTAISVASIPFGTSKETAARIIEDGFLRARAKLDDLERVYHAYGPEAFSPRAEPVPAKPLAGATRHDIVVNAMRWASKRNAVLVKAGDTYLHLDKSGSYEIFD